MEACIECKKEFKLEDGYLDPEDGFTCDGCLEKIEKEISAEIHAEVNCTNID